MALVDFIEKASQSVAGWVVAATLGGASALVVKMVRRVFTNQQTIKDHQSANENSIALLRQEIVSREELRKIDRAHIIEKIGDVQAAIEATQKDVKELFRR